MTIYKQAGLVGLLSLAMAAGAAFADQDDNAASERREHMRQMCKDNPEQCKAMMKERADKWWARVDTNKDGMVSREEANANAPRLAKDFDKVDADHNGQITREELEAAGKARMAERRAHSGGASQN
jgi:Ca2+-binding EF-hand superfamily protein